MGTVLSILSRYLLPAGLERLLENAAGTNVDLKQATKLALDVSFCFFFVCGKIFTCLYETDTHNAIEESVFPYKTAL